MLDSTSGPQSLTTMMAMLAAAGIEEVQREARYLLRCALIDDPWSADLDAIAAKVAIWPVREPVPEQAMALTIRRANHEPLAYIRGWQEWFGERYIVSPDVLIPRPESEDLLEALMDRLSPGGIDRVVDLGCGSGCLGLTLIRLGVARHLVAVDVSPAALAITWMNARRLGVEQAVRTVCVDVCDADWTSRVLDSMPMSGADLVVSNPPYVHSADWSSLPPEVQFEPRLALDGGCDGLNIIRSLLVSIPRLMKPGGLVGLEMGQGQCEQVRQLAQEVSGTGDQGVYQEERITHDLLRIARAVTWRCVP